MSKAEIALQEATRSLEYQERTLDSLRTRAAITLTVGYVATGFLSDVSARHSTWFWLGVLGLTGLTASVVAIHCPVKIWVTFSAYDLVSRFVDVESFDYDTMARDLAYDAQDLHDRNSSVLRDRTAMLVGSIASCGLAIGPFLAKCRSTMRIVMRAKPKRSESPKRPKTLAPNPGQPSERGRGTFSDPSKDPERPKTIAPNPGQATKR